MDMICLRPVAGSLPTPSASSAFIDAYCIRQAFHAFATLVEIVSIICLPMPAAWLTKCLCDRSFSQAILPSSSNGSTFFLSLYYGCLSYLVKD
ncbi:hypothetical protein CDL15_Pgr006163 [Punica granatum]|uniref:Uncharacterized protein n=1 Tax=Punica granatum TaxID=22663 RepID=A0A218VV55_PUNGR|nr:hypothetical protein CDL15_Pgr006163 [Punica granatum]